MGRTDRLLGSRPPAFNGSAAPHCIELYEWEPKDVWLPPEAVADITRCQIKAINVQLLSNGATRITAGPFVGRIRVGTVDLLLRPKCPIPALLTLLMEVHELTHLLRERALFRTTEDIVDLLVQVFLQQVDNLVHQGLKRTYVGLEEERVSVRGRIDIVRTLALHIRAQPRISCSYEEYILDCTENRAVLAALLAIEANGSLPQVRRKVAHQMMADFVGVSTFRMRSQDVAAITCDRLSAHYAPILRLAEVILASMGLANDVGGIESNGFLVDMNMLFEQFIYRRLRGLLAKDGIRVNRQLTFPFDEKQQAAIRPDLIIRFADDRRIVADTKYKVGNLDRADLYQMLAYCRVLGIAHGIIISVGEQGMRRYRMRDGATVIDVVPVALGGGVADIHESIVRLANKISSQNCKTDG